jgi:hypothetical protein
MSTFEEIDELATVLKPAGAYDFWPQKAAELALAAGYRKIFDGDCGLSNITDPTDREAAEAWMRFSNIVLGNGHDGIAAMKQMLTEFGYSKEAAK